MDSSGSDSRHPSRLLQTGLVPPISGLQTAIDFDFDENEDADISTDPDPDSDRHWNSVRLQSRAMLPLGSHWVNSKFRVNVKVSKGDVRTQTLILLLSLKNRPQ